VGLRPPFQSDLSRLGTSVETEVYLFLFFFLFFPPPILQVPHPFFSSGLPFLEILFVFPLAIAFFFPVFFFLYGVLVPLTMERSPLTLTLSCFHLFFFFRSLVFRSSFFGLVSNFGVFSGTLLIGLFFSCLPPPFRMFRRLFLVALWSYPVSGQSPIFFRYNVLFPCAFPLPIRIFFLRFPASPFFRDLLQKQSSPPLF